MQMGDPPVWKADGSVVMWFNRRTGQYEMFAALWHPPEAATLATLLNEYQFMELRQEEDTFDVDETDPAPIDPEAKTSDESPD
jgi:hypothetical protein